MRHCLLILPIFLASCAMFAGPAAESVPPAPPHTTAPSPRTFGMSSAPGARKHQRHTADCGHDRDGDGIIAARNQCSRTPAGHPVDAGGCGEDPGPWPDTLPQWLTVDFVVDSAVLSVTALNQLDQDIRDLKHYPSLSAIIVDPTDSDHNLDYNKRLGILRAHAARRRLVQADIDGQPLLMDTFGETMPAQPNDSFEGKKLNRRVVLRASLPRKNPYLIEHDLRHHSDQPGAPVAAA